VWYEPCHRRLVYYVPRVGASGKRTISSLYWRTVSCLDRWAIRRGGACEGHWARRVRAHWLMMCLAGKKHCGGGENGNCRASQGTRCSSVARQSCNGYPLRRLKAQCCCCAALDQCCLPATVGQLRRPRGKVLGRAIACEVHHGQTNVALWQGNPVLDLPGIPGARGAGDPAVLLQKVSLLIRCQLPIVLVPPDPAKILGPLPASLVELVGSGADSERGM
jgi:hypothetical protein